MKGGQGGTPAGRGGAMDWAQKRRGYLTAICCSVLLLALRFAARDPLGEQAILLPFVLAVMAAAWVGGLGPGLLATALSALLAVLFLIPPLLSLWIDRVAHGLNVA